MNGRNEIVNSSQRISSAYITDKNVSIEIFGYGTVKYCFFWLRDNCRCHECYNTITFQRNKHILDIPEDAYPQDIQINDGNLKVEWNDSHISEYSAEFLYECCPYVQKKTNVSQMCLWSGKEVEKRVAAVNRDEFLHCDETLKIFLKSLVKYGVAFVDNVGANVEDTELIIKRLAPIQRTLFGDFWSFTSNQARADTAYTKIPLAPHTDNTYFTEAAGLQVFHCFEHDGIGGETVLLDGFYGAQEFEKSDPKGFKMLTTVHQEAEYVEKGWHHTFSAPVINVDPITKDIRQIRYNVYDRSSHSSLLGDDVQAMYSALRGLSKQYARKEQQWWFKLTPGRVLFFDNWRVLHGRAGFSGKRVLGGAYVSRGDWLSAARVHGLIP